MRNDITRSALGALVLAAVASAATTHAQTTSSAPPHSTAKEKRVLGGVDMYGVPGEPEFFFRSRYFIDADGAPNAYHPGYTCDAAGQTGWKEPENLACASRAHAHECRGKGFDGSVAYGQVAPLVRCEWERGACSAHEIKRQRQGGCRADEGSRRGLDSLANAGAPGRWWAVVTDGAHGSGTPYVQKEGDPFPGFYVSATSLSAPHLPESDPHKWLDSTRINYIALPPGTGASPGDMAVVVRWPTKQIAYAIFGDVGHEGSAGEGSIALAAALGLGTDLHRGGDTEHHDEVYLVFKGKQLTHRFPLAQMEIDTYAGELFALWGGLARLEALAP